MRRTLADVMTDITALQHRVGLCQEQDVEQPIICMLTRPDQIIATAEATLKRRETIN